MLYPPCESVFYQLNPNPEEVDVKKRYQINPELTLDEMWGILDSFVLVGADKPVTWKNKSGELVQTSFAEAIRDIFMAANELPTARLWLRRIPSGMHISCVDRNDVPTINGVNALLKNGEVNLMSDRLCQPLVRNVITLIHELAHAIDCRDIGGLTIFPYDTVNAGETLKCFNLKNLTEAEIMRLFLIDEAEKNALTQQLECESGQDMFTFGFFDKMDSLMKKYQRVFAGWQPPEQAGVWTADEIKKERFDRSYFYASAEMMAGQIRHFLKSYSDIWYELPKSVRESSRSTNDDRLINFDELPRLNLSVGKLKTVANKIGDFRMNLEYRCMAYHNLINYICWQMARQSGNPTMMSRDFFLNNVASNLRMRKSLVPNEPSAEFNDYIHRIEGRYLGFVRERDLQPNNSTENVYLEQNNKNPSKSLIDIKTSCLITEALLRRLSHDANKYFYPYCVKRLSRSKQADNQRTSNGREG